MLTSGGAANAILGYAPLADLAMKDRWYCYGLYQPLPEADVGLRARPWAPCAAHAA